MKRPPSVIMEEVSDPRELDRARAQDERFERNWSWFNRHAQEIYAAHRGKCLCIAGEELFVADSPEQALALARTAHPDDGGFFTRIIPRERMARIYALDGGRDAASRRVQARSRASNP